MGAALPQSSQVDEVTQSIDHASSVGFTFFVSGLTPCISKADELHGESFSLLDGLVIEHVRAA